MDAPRAATDLYHGFHRYAPIQVGEFYSSFEIPAHALKQGAALDILYRSAKTDPETLKRPRKPIDYIHDHDPGVFTYLPRPLDKVTAKAERVEVPAWIRDVSALVLLGQCLGFSFEAPDGRTVEAETEDPLPELYATTNGKALIVVQDKRELVAMIWGGKLGVEPRGIVG